MSNVGKVLGGLDRGVNRLQTGCMLLFFNILFAGFCAWGAYAGYISWTLQQEGRTTTGIVVKLEEHSGVDSGCCTYSPVIEFVVEGRPYSFEDNNSSYPPAYEVGEQVQVRYHPAHPDTAQIDSFFRRWGFPLIIIPSMLGAALILNSFLLRSFRRGESIG